MDLTTLLVKNFPKNVKPQDFFQGNFKASSAKYYGRSRVIVHFNNSKDANDAIFRLHQLKIGNKILSVEFLGKRKFNSKNYIRSNERSSKNLNDELPNYIKPLTALSSYHGFMHPPSPNLKYSYPKINRDILDAISIVLMSNSKFYTQVLHLMNRMNLDPPFLDRKVDFVPPGETRDAATQTTFEKMERNLASDESELDYSSDENFIESVSQIDRTQHLNEKRKLKLKKVLQSQSLVNKIPKAKRKVINTIDNTFSFVPPRKMKKLSIGDISQSILDKKEQQKLENNKEKAVELEDNILNDKEIEESKLTIKLLEENRIPMNQLKELPIFKNYEKGTESHKLYIKNLGKDVSIDDLKSIFGLFVDDIENDLEIKLMQKGRMKGQAFITFLKFNSKDFSIVHNALNLTNGYILKNKPMIVCFGKNK